MQTSHALIDARRRVTRRSSRARRQRTLSDARATKWNRNEVWAINPPRE
jgi:hypothetical protein